MRASAFSADSLLAFTWLLRNASITTVATYAYVNPVVAVLGGALIVASVALVVGSRR